MLSLNEIISIIRDYQPKILENTTFTAAVMIIILHSNENNLEIVITQRSINLPTYSGHYSFPGGMRDSTDKDLYATAQREVKEELQLIPESYQYLGQLDDMHDRYGNLVRPFVTLMDKQIFLDSHKPSLEEIQTIVYLPLAELEFFRDNPDLYTITNRRPSYSYTKEEVFIWGLTAGILMRFAEVIQLMKDNK